LVTSCDQSGNRNGPKPSVYYYLCLAILMQYQARHSLSVCRVTDTQTGTDTRWRHIPCSHSGAW